MAALKANAVDGFFHSLQAFAEQQGHANAAFMKEFLRRADNTAGATPFIDTPKEWEQSNMIRCSAADLKPFMWSMVEKYMPGLFATHYRPPPGPAAMQSVSIERKAQWMGMPPLVAQPAAAAPSGYALQMPHLEVFAEPIAPYQPPPPDAAAAAPWDSGVVVADSALSPPPPSVEDTLQAADAAALPAPTNDDVDTIEPVVWQQFKKDRMTRMMEVLMTDEVRAHKNQIETGLRGESANVNVLSAKLFMSLCAKGSPLATFMLDKAFQPENRYSHVTRLNVNQLDPKKIPTGSENYEEQFKELRTILTRCFQLYQKKTGRTQLTDGVCGNNGALMYGVMLMIQYPSMMSTLSNAMPIKLQSESSATGSFILNAGTTPLPRGPRNVSNLMSPTPPVVYQHPTELLQAAGAAEMASNAQTLAQLQVVLKAMEPGDPNKDTVQGLYDATLAKMLAGPIQAAPMMPD